MATQCPKCDDTGFRIVRRGDGAQFAENCECRIEKRLRRLMSGARIPQRFGECSLEDYSTVHLSSNQSLERALSHAKHFVEGFPVDTQGKGLLFVGPKGLGKTHLSVSILKSLILERGASGVFWEHKELMEAFRSAMFGSGEQATESRVLDSVLKSDVLVLDDLGDLTKSDWTYDTTSYILNSRYNGELCTIITTNLENLGSLTMAAEPVDVFAEKRTGRRPSFSTTLGDRIGDRMWSRLQEMCVVVEMQGEDFRQKVKRASFAS